MNESTRFPHRNSISRKISSFDINNLFDYDVKAMGITPINFCWACFSLLMLVGGWTILMLLPYKNFHLNVTYVIYAVYCMQLVFNIIIPFPTTRIGELIRHIQKMEEQEGYTKTSSVVLYFYYVLTRRCPGSGFTRFILLQSLLYTPVMSIAYFITDPAILAITAAVMVMMTVFTVYMKLESECEPHPNFLNNGESE